MDVSQPDPDRSAVEGESAPPARPRWGWAEVVVVFLLGWVPAAILQLVALGQEPAVRTGLVAVSLAYQSAVWVVLGVLVVRLRGDRPGGIGWQAPRPSRAVKAGLLGIFVVVAAVFVAQGVMIALLSLFMSPREAAALLTNEQALQRELLPTGPLTAGGAAALVVFACVAPIGEEMMFRGLLHTALRDRFGATAAVIAGSAGFALLHLLRFHLLAFFGVGVVLALLRERTGSLLPPVIAHTGLNTITMLIWLMQ